MALGRRGVGAAWHVGWSIGHAPRRWASVKRNGFLPATQAPWPRQLANHDGDRQLPQQRDSQPRQRPSTTARASRHGNGKRRGKGLAATVMAAATDNGKSPSQRRGGNGNGYGNGNGALPRIWQVAAARVSRPRQPTDGTARCHTQWQEDSRTSRLPGRSATAMAGCRYRRQVRYRWQVRQPWQRQPGRGTQPRRTRTRFPARDARRGPRPVVSTGGRGARLTPGHEAVWPRAPTVPFRRTA